MAFAHPLLALAFLLVLAGSAAAQSVEDFFRGKTITLTIGTGPGGGYDLYGRLVAAYIGRHIPGNPSVIAKNMPGAGGVAMLNWLYTVAPKDGTQLAAAPQALAIEQVLGAPGLQYDARSYTWIGRCAPVVEVMYTSAKSPTRTIDDARLRETVMGGTGPTSPTITYLTMLNVLAGTRFKPISGYPSTTEVNLAMERGEVDGSIKAWASVKADNPDWITEKKVNFLMQFAIDKPPELVQVPLMTEIARTADDREAMGFYAAGNAMGRSIFATPGIPADRTAALRAAFLAAMADPTLLAEAGKRQIDIDPLSGEDLQKLVDKTLGVSPAALERARTARPQQ
jgi:tripartite-type tricarboxylate transporter receptor subunit TctC